jgi:hypothetical protein
MIGQVASLARAAWVAAWAPPGPNRMRAGPRRRGRARFVLLAPSRPGLGVVEKGSATDGDPKV